MATEPRDKDFGKFQFGCEHYKRRCKIRAPCCNLIFPCRHCHNEAANDMIWSGKASNRLFVQYVKLSKRLLKSARIAESVWENTFAISANSFILCRLFFKCYKEQFHCDDCGICRVGGRGKFFHCNNCGACYDTRLRDKHSCIENSTKNSCPVCYEYLFDSVKAAHVMKCGLTMHIDCFEQMINQAQYRCPICSKSALDMTSQWQLLDREISATEMPVEYKIEVMSINPTFCHLLRFDHLGICSWFGMTKKVFALTATREAIPCSTFWDTSAHIVHHTTLAEYQLHKTRHVKESDRFLNLG